MTPISALTRHATLKMLITDTSDLSLVMLQASGTASLNDMYVLSQGTAFQNRVQAALIAQCLAVQSEGWTVANHQARETLALAILNASGSSLTPYVQSMANSVATNTAVINDATQAATNYTPLTTANVTTQTTFVLDADVISAVSLCFGLFIFH